LNSEHSRCMINGKYTKKEIHSHRQETMLHFFALLMYVQQLQREAIKGILPPYRSVI
jgi:hypothetical protein